MKKIQSKGTSWVERPKRSTRLSYALGIGLVVVAFGFASCKKEQAEQKQTPPADNETQKTALIKKTGSDTKSVAKAPVPPEGSAAKVVKEKNILWSAERDGFSQKKPQTPDKGSGASDLLAKLNQDLPPVPEHTKLSAPASLTLLYNSGAFGELDSCG